MLRGDNAETQKQNPLTPKRHVSVQLNASGEKSSHAAESLSLASGHVKVTHFSSNLSIGLVIELSTFITGAH